MPATKTAPRKTLEDLAGRRREFLRITLRGVRPGTGSALATLRRRTALTRWPDLSRPLRGIPWAVVGGVATRAYMQERGTGDLDVLVPASASAEVRTRLANAGYRRIQALAVGGSSWRSPDGIQVDVLESDEPWVEEALRRPVRDPQGLPVPRLPFLVFMKVRSGRTQDMADASRMLGQASARARAGVREVFRRLAPATLEDLESLIHLGDLELQPDRGAMRGGKHKRR